MDVCTDAEWMHVDACGWLHCGRGRCLVECEHLAAGCDCHAQAEVKVWVVVTKAGHKAVSGPMEPAKKHQHHYANIKLFIYTTYSLFSESTLMPLLSESALWHCYF